MQTSLSREVSTGNWEWPLTTSSLTQLCVVTDNSVPERAADTLARNFAGVPQVAMLRVRDPVSFHREWIASSQQEVTSAALKKRDTTPLHQLPRSVHLVVWSNVPDTLDWIGSVQGHATSHARYCSDEDEGAAARLGIERVYGVLRAIVRQNLGIGV